MFGFDHDTDAVFEDTLDFLEETGLQNATFNILSIECISRRLARSPVGIWWTMPLNLSYARALSRSR